MSKPTVVCAVVLGICLVGGEAGRAAVPYYNVTDLGTLGGASVARSVNSLGQVVGTYEAGLGKTGAFLWTAQGGMLDLPGLGGDNTFAYDINSAGQIVGAADTAGGALHARLWDTAGHGTDINPGPDYWSAAYAINENGRAVLQGNLTTQTFGTRLILWDAAGGFVDRRSLEGIDAIGWDINNTDTVALSWEAIGSRSDVVGLDAPAYFWHPENGLWFVPPLTGSMSGNSYGINDRNIVVGGFAVREGRNMVWKAFMFVPQYGNQKGYERPYIGRGYTYSLGTLGGDSIAWAINHSSQIVGTSALLDDTLHAFISQYDEVEESRVLHDLNNLLVDNPGWVLNEAYGINDVGQIVGYGVNPQGQTHAFLLTPVPEPGAPAAMVVAGMLLGLRRR